MEFRKLTVDDKKLFQSYIDKNDLGWEYNFATVFLWDVNDTMMMATEDGILFIYNTFYNSIVFMPPYMKNDSDFLKAVGKISEYAREKKIVYRAIEEETSTPKEEEYNTLVVPRGGEYMVELSDGTKVWLNSDSELRFPITLSLIHISEPTRP